MQHIHGEASEPASALGWLGVELLTVFQVLSVLILGYAVSRVWILLRPRAQQASTKKVDDVNIVDDVNMEQDEIPEVDESFLPARPTIKARHTNSLERKRMRKTNPVPAATDLQQPLPEEVEAVQEMPVSEDTAAADERIAKSKTKKAERKARKAQLQIEAAPEPAATHLQQSLPQEIEAVQEMTVSEDTAAANERVAKLMMKKAERKARKTQLQREAEVNVEGSLPFPANAEKADSDTLSQDGQTSLSQTASTPSVVSEQGDCSTDMLDSSRSQSPSNDTESPTAKVAVSEGSSKKTKATKKKQPSKSRAEAAQQESSTISTNSATVTTDASKIDEVSTGIKSSSLEAVPKDESLETNDRTSGEYKHHDDETFVQHTSESDTIMVNTQPISANTRANLDDLDSDWESDVDSTEHPSEQMAGSHGVQNFQDVPNAPVMWCGLPQSPNAQIDGWVAVAVPAECAPPGAFDGLWMNIAEEKILIEKLEIMFESGVSWDMEMHSSTTMSVELDGQKVHAELDSSGEQLLWSDGDVWTFFGSAQDATQAMPELIPELMPELMPEPVPELMPELMPEFSCMMMVPMPSGNQFVSAGADSWDNSLCWDWMKKGRCPRGVKCEWYHPTPEMSYF